MRKVAKSRKHRSKHIDKDKEGLLGLSMLGLSGFHICDIHSKKTAPTLFRKRRIRKAVLA